MFWNGQKFARKGQLIYYIGMCNARVRKGQLVRHMHKKEREKGDIAQSFHMMGRGKYMHISDIEGAQVFTH